MRPPALTLLLVGVLGTASRPGDIAAQTNSAPPQVRVNTVALTERVHVVAASQAGTVNAIFSAGPDGVLLVDTMTEPLSSHLRTEIAAVSKMPIRAVVNTHWHGDHVGGNRHFPSATILAHPRVRERISREQTLPWMPEVVPPEPAAAWPAITFAGPVSVHFNGEEIRLVPIPGSHTDADVIAIFMESKVVCLGDVIHFVGGRLMPGSSAFSGGDLRRLRQHLTTILPQVTSDARVVPGHGPVLTKDDVESYGRVIDAVLAHVAAERRAGRTADELKAAGLPARIAALTRWPLSDTAWIQTAYDADGGEK